MKHAIVFIGSNYNNLDNINKIKSQVNSNYTVYSINNNSNIQCDYVYSADILKNEYTDIPRYFSAIDKLYNKLQSYDYIYVVNNVIDIDNWQYLFSILEDYDQDFICSDLKCYDYNSHHKYACRFIDYYKDVSSVYIARLFIYRLSNKSFEFLHNNIDKLDIFGDDISIPTNLIHNNFSYYTLNTIFNMENIFFGTSFNSKINDIFNNKQNTPAVEDTSIDDISQKYIYKMHNNNVKYSIVVPYLYDYLQNNIEFDQLLQKILNLDIHNDIEIIIVCESLYDDNIKQKLTSILNTYHSLLNIQLIRKDKTGLAECLNLGIINASSDFVYIHYPNNILTKTRLIAQFNLLQTNPIVISNSVYSSFDDILTNTFTEYGAQLALNRQLLLHLPFLFEEYYKDYFRKLLYNCYIHNISVLFDKTDYNESINIEYNISDKELTKIHKLYNFKNDGRLSCILTFRNEAHEVERTVQSIRSTANNVQIVLVNDASTDSTDYEWVANTYKCIYIKHDESVGCGPSRDDGVEHINSEYFMLNDAHMRYYHMGWDDTVIKYLDDNPKSILCGVSCGFNKKMPCQQQGLSTDVNGYIRNEDSLEYEPHGQCCEMNTKYGYLCDLSWTGKRFNWDNPDEELFPVVGVMGACYASSKSWWDYIEGLHGLSIYGLDEGLMSYKTWMMGGQVLCMGNLYIGHFYRDKHPYYSPIVNLEAIRLLLVDLFLDDPDEIKNHQDIIKEKFSGKQLEELIELYDKYKIKHADMIVSCKSKFVKPYSSIIEMNSKLINRPEK